MLCKTTGVKKFSSFPVVRIWREPHHDIELTYYILNGTFHCLFFPLKLATPALIIRATEKRLYVRNCIVPVNETTMFQTRFVVADWMSFLSFLRKRKTTKNFQQATRGTYTDVSVGKFPVAK